MSCGHCPRRGLACLGAEVARLCELVDPGHAAYNPAYLGLLEPPCEESTGVDSSHSISVAESLRLTLEARKCPYRSAPTCSCEGAAHCGLKRTDVTAATCWDCVRRHGV